METLHHLHCPHCEQIVRVRTKHLGHVLVCPHCSTQNQLGESKKDLFTGQATHRQDSRSSSFKSLVKAKVHGKWHHFTEYDRVHGDSILVAVGSQKHVIPPEDWLEIANDKKVSSNNRTNLRANPPQLTATENRLLKAHMPNCKCYACRRKRWAGEGNLAAKAFFLLACLVTALLLCAAMLAW